MQYVEYEYIELYNQSINDPDGFWGRVADRLDWFEKPSIIQNASFEDDVSIKWYEDGILNACYNCVDRHLPDKADHLAFIVEGDKRAEY